MTDGQARQLASMFHAISEAIEEEKDGLSELDGAIGDADHGMTMSIGFLAVNTALARLDLEKSGPSDVLATAANAFLDAVGASTGPLYAAAFLRAAAAVKEHRALDGAFIAAMLSGIAEGIRERGKGQRGDKTMLDAWIPAAEAAHSACDCAMPLQPMLHEIASAAEAGADATRSMIASKGRAARVGERSLGHIDPGAASAKLIIEVMCQSFARMRQPL